MNVYAKLQAVQSALKAPKSQYNKFGGYYYRKAEDIDEAVKPLLKEVGGILTCSDELVLIGERYYIKATATFTDCETGQSISTTAFAREEAEKKGMDGSQITGASSSYARKYALNGLLCIDDTADSDTTNTGDDKPKAEEKKQAPKKTAPAKKDTAPYKALSNETYWKVVQAQGDGRLTKTGKTYREAFIEQTNAPEDVIARFDKDVADYVKATKGEEI